MAKMIIKGFQATSMIDYPGNICSVVFLAGCNFKCQFCYNSELALNSSELKEISEEDVFEMISKKKHLIDGVCITGGEPTLYSDLMTFCNKIKDLGLKVKLDTNGTNPKLIADLIEEGSVDYIAMDIKQNQEKYAMITDCKVDIDKIEKSIEIIRGSDIDYEFRITVVPELISAEDIIEIAEWLKGAKKFVMQKFVPKNKMFNNKLSKKITEKDLVKIAEKIKHNFDKVEIR